MDFICLQRVLHKKNIEFGIGTILSKTRRKKYNVKYTSGYLRVEKQNDIELLDSVFSDEIISLMDAILTVVRKGKYGTYVSNPFVFRYDKEYHMGYSDKIIRVFLNEKLLIYDILTYTYYNDVLRFMKAISLKVAELK